MGIIFKGLPHLYMYDHHESMLLDPAVILEGENSYLTTSTVETSSDVDDRNLVSQ